MLKSLEVLLEISLLFPERLLNSSICSSLGGLNKTRPMTCNRAKVPPINKNKDGTLSNNTGFTKYLEEIRDSIMKLVM